MIKTTAQPIRVQIILSTFYKRDQLFSERNKGKAPFAGKINDFNFNGNSMF